MKKSHFRDIKAADPETFHGPGHFADSALESSLEARQRPAVVDRAQRFRQPVGAAGQHDRGAGSLCLREQPLQELRGKFGHIAGHNQVPIGRSMVQRGQNAAQGTLARIPVGNPAQFGVAHKCHAARRLFHLARHGFGQRAAAERQPGLIAPHAGTAPPRQHISRPRHTKMITLGLHKDPCIANPPAAFLHTRKIGNTGHHFCFTLVLAILTAGALFAAGPDQPQRVTSVVRPDLRTGKLVRSMVVSPKAVSHMTVGHLTVDEQRVPETVVPPRAAAPPAAPEPVDLSTGIDQAVQRIAREQSLSPQLIHSVIKVESNYNPLAVSSKGALGLMQLIPATARRFGVSDAFNPVQNIQGGARYLRYLLDLFNGSYPLALAAYNAGEAAVTRYGGIPPYAETQNYVDLVRKKLEQAKSEQAGLEQTRKADAARLAAGPASVIEAKETVPAHIIEQYQPDGSVRYVSQ